MITIVFDPSDQELPWAVEDNRQTVPKVTRHRSRGAVLERLVEILSSIPQLKRDKRILIFPVRRFFQ